MSRSLEQFHRDVISGADQGARGKITRFSLLLAEPFYTSVVAARNECYDRGIFHSQRIARPVVSIGNITTGGTGKTPVTRWLVEKFLAVGLHPAVLTRGYKGGDEQKLLQSQLPGVPIHANPSRIDGAQTVLNSEKVDLFILDDGFQHRKVHREFDLVLIDASNPFGFGHVLPRGLLREPLDGLSRAHAFLITHTELDCPLEIEHTLRRLNPEAPIYCCRHIPTGLHDLSGQKVLVFCGIGNPSSFFKQVESIGAAIVNSRFFDDHHRYSVEDLTILGNRARMAGADVLVTTEKDWVKLAELVSQVSDLPPIVRAQLTIQFENDDERRLFERIEEAVKL
jgi:tetraacyldisaccharide 4'-kinase